MQNIILLLLINKEHDIFILPMNSECGITPPYHFLESPYFSDILLLNIFGKKKKRKEG